MKKNIILIVFTIVVILNSESYGQIKDLQEIIDRLEPANKASIIAKNGVVGVFVVKFTVLKY